MKSWQEFLKKKRVGIEAERNFANKLNNLYNNEESDDIKQWIKDWKDSIIYVTDMQEQLLVHKVEDIIINSMKAYPSDIKDLKKNITRLDKLALKKEKAKSKLEKAE